MLEIITIIKEINYYMSIKSIKYLQSIKENDETLFYNAFVISIIGLIGLAKINENSNAINLKLKQYRNVLNSINSNSLDIYTITQYMFDKKMITLSYGLRLIELLQMFRYSKYNIDDIIDESIDVLNDLPTNLKNKLSIDIKIVLDSLDKNNITHIVSRLYNYSLRKKLVLDFVDIAKNLKIRI